MLIKAVFKEAEKTLNEHTIEDFVIGLKVAAVTLNNGATGTAMVLLEELDSGCHIQLSREEIIGMEAIEMAKWALNPNEHVLKRTLGIAAMNACAYNESFTEVETKDASMSVELNENDVVGVIGYVRPLVNAIKDKVKQVIIYDKGLQTEVYEQETQAELLPKCDVLYITGTTFINNTIDELLHLGRNTREVVLVGPTTPLFPNAYKNTSVTMLAGGIWAEQCKDEMYKRISSSGGVPTLSKFLKKKSVRI